MSFSPPVHQHPFSSATPTSFGSSNSTNGSPSWYRNTQRNGGAATGLELNLAASPIAGGANDNFNTNYSPVGSGLNGLSPRFGNENGTANSLGSGRNNSQSDSASSRSSRGNRHHEEELINNAIEAEEERIVNVLSRKLEQLREDKISLENILEAESENRVNKLCREIGELRKVNKELETKLTAAGSSASHPIGSQGACLGRDNGQHFDENSKCGAQMELEESSSKLKLLPMAGSYRSPGQVSMPFAAASNMNLGSSKLSAADNPSLSRTKTHNSNLNDMNVDSTLLDAEALQRENLRLRNRLAESEREYIRLKRLNDVSREELISLRGKLGLPVANLIGQTSTDKDPLSQPTHITPPSQGSTSLSEFSSPTSPYRDYQHSYSDSTAIGMNASSHIRRFPSHRNSAIPITAPNASVTANVASSSRAVPGSHGLNASVPLPIARTLSELHRPPVFAHDDDDEVEEADEAETGTIPVSISELPLPSTSVIHDPADSPFASSPAFSPSHSRSNSFPPFSPIESSSTSASSSIFSRSSSSSRQGVRDSVRGRDIDRSRGRGGPRRDGEDPTSYQSVDTGVTSLPSSGSFGMMGALGHGLGYHAFGAMNAGMGGGMGQGQAIANNANGAGIAGMVIGGIGIGAYGVPQRGLSYPSVPPPSLSSSFGSAQAPSPSVGLSPSRDVSLSPVDSLSRRGSFGGGNSGRGSVGEIGGGASGSVAIMGGTPASMGSSSRRVLPTGGRVAETGSLLPHSRSRSRAGSMSNLGHHAHTNSTLPETVDEMQGEAGEGWEELEE